MGVNALFDQIFDLVSQPPGSLVYHFIILFAVQAALAIGLGQWLRERDSSTARLTLGITAIFAARAVVLLASLLAWQGFQPRDILLPPVERAADTATLLALFWVFVTMDDPAILRRNFTVDLTASVILGMIVAGFVGTYYYRFSSSSDLVFNGNWLDILWSSAQILIGVIALIWMLARIKYVYDPFLKGMILIILAGAAGLHLVRPPFGDVSSSLRIGQLIAMPMLAAVAYRHVVEQLLHWDEFEPSRIAKEVRAAPATLVPAPSRPVELVKEEALPTPSEAEPPADEEKVDIPEQPADQPAVLEIVESLGGLLSTLEQADISKEAARVVASALRADVCALAVIDDMTQEAGIIGGYDNITQLFLPQTVLDLGDHPSIVNALGRLRQMRLIPSRNNSELRDLYQKLMITHVGPAYIQPLVDNDDRIGVLIVGSPYSERQLSDEERNLLDRLAPLVSAAMINAETYQIAREESNQIVQEEGARLASLADELTAVQIEYDSARRQMEEMKAYIRDLHRQLESVREVDGGEVDQARAEMVQLIEELAQTRDLQARYDNLVERYDQMVEAYDQLKQSENASQAAQEQVPDTDRIGELEAEIMRLRDEIAGHENSPELTAASKIEAHFLERQLEDARLAAQTEIASLRTRLSQAAISQQEVAFLQEQLAARAREVITMQTRLTEAEAIATALREQIQSGPSSSIASLQGRIAAQAAEIEGLRNQLTDVEAHSRMTPEAQQEQREAEAIDREAMAQLEAQLAERAALVDQLERQLAERTRAISELKGHMSEVDASLRNLERRLSHKTEEIAQLQASLAEARQQAQARIAELGESMEQDAIEEIEMHRARAEALEAELGEKAASIAVLEEQLQNTTQSMKELESQLSATNEAVGEAISSARQGDSHDEVIASVAQELRTPMSSIMGYTELLLRESVGILGSLQRKFLQRVKANTERMGVLLDDLIRITALDTGTLELEPERVDVTYAIEEVIMNVASQYREKGLVLRLSIAERLPALTADRDVVLQVLGHLLTNAALASPVEGEVQFLATSRTDTVPVFGDEQVSCLYISVEDSGGGVPPEDHERVFMRKYRADNPLIEGLGDTGVSLSLAKALIDAHGGRIWLTAQEGIGTTFHILLPLEPPPVGEGVDE